MDVDSQALEVEGILKLIKFKNFHFLRCFIILSFGFMVACQSTIMKLEKEEDIQLKSDLDNKVVIEEASAESVSAPGISHKPPPLLKPEPKKKSVQIINQKKIKKEMNLESTEISIEDKEGFLGRRPLKDPFYVGEKITHSAYYNIFGFTAGILTLDTLPFVQVNGRKAYKFEINLKTTKLFNSIYSVEDRVVTLVDYDLWLPRLYTLHVKESSQLREGRSFFDFQKLKARYEEKKVSKKKGAEEKKLEWDILPYSQNVFSVIYYMRLFQWKDGKDYSFRVADENENLIFKGRVISREVLDTDIGPIKAIKIKPEIILRGNFKPVGDIFIWLSDDERKIPLRIESKIKIGTIVSEITDYKPGQAP